MKKLINKSKGTTLLEHTAIADAFGKRFLGLMGRRALLEGEGLMLTPCSAIHTFFMRMEIDVLYINREGQVMKVDVNVKPWKILQRVRGAWGTVEAAGGAFEGKADVGDHLELIDRHK